MRERGESNCRSSEKTSVIMTRDSFDYSKVRVTKGRKDDIIHSYGLMGNACEQWLSDQREDK